jgi:ABC-type Zn uptake system ZnuABC Zn-binding protein ZnuA
MRMIESAELVVTSGAGLENFLDGTLDEAHFLIDASKNTHTHAGEHDLDHGHHGHEHEIDPHIWLSPENAKIMAENICAGLSEKYPAYAAIFAANLEALLTKLDTLQAYGNKALSQLSCRELITFHDGFAYFAESFDLTILEAVEEESGSEASAADLKRLIKLTEEHDLPAIFTELNGSVSAADVISAQTGATVYALDMAMSGDSYFNAMYHNINIIKEALG